MADNYSSEFVFGTKDKDEKDYTEGSMPVGINITPFN